MINDTAMIDSTETDYFNFYEKYNAGKVLSREDELDLIIKAQNGNERALDKLCRHNFGIVFKIANQMGMTRNIGKDLSAKDDLFQLGMIGIITAIQKFDIESGLKLSTYATHWVRQSIQRSWVQGELGGRGLIRVPNHIGVIVSLLKQTIVRTNEEITTEEDAIRIYRKYASDHNLAKVHTDDSVRAAYHHLQTNGIVGHYEDMSSPEFDDGDDGFDFLSKQESDAINPSDAICTDEIKKQIWEVLETLNPRERHIIVGRFGMGVDGKTLEEIAKEIGVTRERVRQIEGKTLIKLKKRIIEAKITA